MSDKISNFIDDLDGVFGVGLESVDDTLSLIDDTFQDHKRWLYESLHTKEITKDECNSTLAEIRIIRDSYKNKRFL